MSIYPLPEIGARNTQYFYPGSPVKVLAALPWLLALFMQGRRIFEPSSRSANRL
ncbi:hypothetical protein LEP1GSC192_3802 [Leptospira sp. B5-022]|nr:hypothetical protein LEP1GSC192_3802 [Leptospira sp. B5-022]